MNAPIRYVQIGVGGFGQHWCRDYRRGECESCTLELDNRSLRAMTDLAGERQSEDIPHTTAHAR